MIFEIYSMGDGLYMKRILDGVAMMSNSGFLMALGGFGLLLGLLLAGMKAIETGGQKVELPSLFVSFLLLLAMFSVKVDSAIYALDGAPGQTGMRMYTVDNVPVGVAFPAMAVTTMGKVITEKFQQAYSVPGMEDLGLSEGQFGNTLKLVDMARRWDIEGLGGNADTRVSVFRRNLVNYMADCTIPGIQRGAISKDTLLSTPTPISDHAAGGGIGFNDRFTATRMIVSGTEQLLDCPDAMQRLSAQANDAGMTSVFLRAALNLTDARSGTADAMNAATAAFAAIGANSSTIQQHVMASAVREIMDEAISGSSALTANEIQAQMMLIQGNRQRQDEWGAGEKMFRVAMRPFMAFLECFVFLATPFMALVIGLGATGLKMVGKYFMINLWIMTWAPMFAAVELFQITQVQHAIKAMQMLGAGSNGVPLSSIAGAAAINAELTTWISVGGWMATLVPPLGFLLLSGGAVAMTSFAGRLAGQDHVNEKLTSPDLASMKAAMDVNSQLSTSRGAGAAISGVDPVNGSFNFQSQAASAVESSRANLQTAQRSANTALTNAVNSTFGTNNSVTDTAAVNRSAGETFGSGTNLTDSQGTSAKQQDDAAKSKTARETDTVNATAQASVSADKKAGGGGGGGTNGSGAAPSASGKAGASVGAGHQQQGAIEAKHGGSAGLSKDDAATLAKVQRAETVGQKMDILGEAAANGSSIAKAALDSYQKTQAASDLESATQNYTETSRQADTFSALSGTSFQSWSHQVASNGGANEAVARAIDAAGRPAYDAALHHVQGQVKNGLFAGTEDQQRVMASALALTGTGNNSHMLIPNSAQDRMEAVADLTNKYSVGAGNTPTGDANANSHLRQNAPQFGDATRAVGSLNTSNLPNRDALVAQVGADVAAGVDVDRNKVGRLSEKADSLGEDGQRREGYFGRRYDDAANAVEQKGIEQIKGRLEQGNDVAPLARGAMTLDNRWGDILNGGSTAGALVQGGYLNYDGGRSIPVAPGGDGVMGGGQPWSAAERLQAEQGNPFLVDPSQAKMGESGQSRYQELVNEVRNSGQFSESVTDPNFVNAVAAARLFQEQRNETGNTDNTTAYVNQSDAKQIETAFRGLNDQQREAIGSRPSTLLQGQNLAGDGGASAVAGDSYVSPQLANASLQQAPAIEFNTAPAAYMPNQELVPNQQRMAADVDRLIDGFSTKGADQK